VSALSDYFGIFLPLAEMPHRVETAAFSCSAELFENLDERPAEQLRDMLMLFDIGAEDESTWNVQNIGGERGLAAQLLLSYPEVYIVFLGASGGLKRPAYCIGQEADAHFIPGGSLLDVIGLLLRHAQGFRAIFDPTGVRAHLKESLVTQSDGVASDQYLELSKSRRKHAASSADEELGFVYLNGYAAYQSGFSSWLLSTEREFRRLLPEEVTSRNSGPATFGVILSDWHLAYPDHIGAVQEGSLLETVSFKNEEQLILITGVLDVRQELIKCENRIRSPKPYGGIYGLLSAGSGRQVNRLQERYGQAWSGIIKIPNRGGIRRRAQAFAFMANRMLQRLRQKILSLELKDIVEPKLRRSHNAPHAHSIVASRLLSRALRLKQEEPQDTESWVQIALLAGEAKEILGGLSQTTAYQAIALQHEAEVGAEVSFFGTSAGIKVQKRLRDLEQEGSVVEKVTAFSGLQGRRESKSAHLNFLLRTVNNLRLRLIAHEQMEAGEDCLRKFSWYQHRLKYLNATSRLGDPMSKAAEWILRLTLGYPDWATRDGTSVRRLITVSSGIILIFAIGYFLLLGYHPTLSAEPKRAERVELAGYHALLTFLEIQPGLTEVQSLMDEPIIRNLGSPWLSVWHLYRLLLIIELGFAYLHLGLLVSVLYRRITKRAP